MNQRQLDILRAELSLVRQARVDIEEQSKNKKVDKDKLQQRSKELANRLHDKGIDNIASFKKTGVATGKNLDELADKAKKSKRKNATSAMSGVMTTMRNMTIFSSAISSVKLLLSAIGKAITVVSKWFSPMIEFLAKIGMRSILKYASVGAVAYVVGWLLWKPIKRFINKARAESTVVKEDIQNCFNYESNTDVLLEVTQLTESGNDDSKISKLDTAIDTCQELLDLLTAGIIGSSMAFAVVSGMSTFVWAMLIGSSLWVLLWVTKRQFKRYKSLQTPMEEVM